MAVGSGTPEQSELMLLMAVGFDFDQRHLMVSRSGPSSCSNADRHQLMLVMLGCRARFPMRYASRAQATAADAHDARVSGAAAMLRCYYRHDFFAQVAQKPHQLIFMMLAFLKHVVNAPVSTRRSS